MIKHEISDGIIKAITLDTNIFDGKQNGLEYGLLKRLQQFKDSETIFVLSDIVVQEIGAHIRKSAADAQSSIKNSLKEAANSWILSKETRINIAQSIWGDDTPETISKKRLDDFIEKTGAVVVKAMDHVAVDNLVNRYFSCLPPFENKESKKYEFPDALALISIESWATQNESKVLVVTNDGGWKAYCKESTWLVAISDLGDALGLFQRETAQYACQLLSEEVRSTDKLCLVRTIEDAIYNQESKFDFAPDACSTFNFDWDWPEYALEFVQIHGIDNDEILFEPIEFGDDYLVALVKVDVNVDISCDYTFSVYDSIDKDYMQIGSVTTSTTEDFVAEVLVTFKGTMPHCTSIEEVEVVKQRVNVDFGNIEPDWGDDHDQYNDED